MSEEIESSNPQEILTELCEQIHAELKVVTEVNMPVVYQMAKTEEGAKQLCDMIATRVMNGLSIGESISAVETELNPNRID
jgi:hypothetical protein